MAYLVKETLVTKAMHSYTKLIKSEASTWNHGRCTITGAACCRMILLQVTKLFYNLFRMSTGSMIIISVAPVSIIWSTIYYLKKYT